MCSEVLTVPHAEVDPEAAAYEALSDSPGQEEPARQPEAKWQTESPPPDTRPAEPAPRRVPQLDEPAPYRPGSRKEPLPSYEEDRPRRAPRVVFEKGWFGSVNSGVAGGLLMIVIAVVWFVLGLMADRIFFYPPILAVIGIISIIKGLVGR
jgi:hypothetical protein